MIDATDYTPEQLLAIVEHRASRCREIAGRTGSEATRLVAEREAERHEQIAESLRVLVRRLSLRLVDDDPDAA